MYLKYVLGPDKKGREYTMKTLEVCCEKTVLGGIACSLNSCNLPGNMQKLWYQER